MTSSVHAAPHFHTLLNSKVVRYAHQAMHFKWAVYSFLNGHFFIVHWILRIALHYLPCVQHNRVRTLTLPWVCRQCRCVQFWLWPPQSHSCIWWPIRHPRLHQKQHYVPYYLSIVFFLSLKYAFGIISMFFTLVRCSIILLRLFLTYLHPCFLPYVQIYRISVHLLMSHEKCPIWQVLFIIKFGTFAFFPILYCILFKFIMFYSKCPKCHTRIFLFV